MKTRLFAALLCLSSLTVLAQQEVDVDIDAPGMQVPAMKVKMRVSAPPEEAPPPPNQGPRQRAPKPPPLQVVGVETFDVGFEMNPQATLRLLSPEGAHAEIWGDDGAYLGGFDVPCEVPARAGRFYRVVITANGALIFDRKVELREYFRTVISFRGVVSAPQPQPQPQPQRPRSETLDFPALVEAIKAESFSSAKLDVLRTAEASFTVDQVGQLIDLFTFSAEKVKVVELTQQRLIDRQNAFKLNSHFTFDADKKQVKAILGK